MKQSSRSNVADKRAQSAREGSKVPPPPARPKLLDPMVRLNEMAHKLNINRAFYNSSPRTYAHDSFIKKPFSHNEQSLMYNQRSRNIQRRCVTYKLDQNAKTDNEMIRPPLFEHKGITLSKRASSCNNASHLFKPDEISEDDVGRMIAAKPVTINERLASNSGNEGVDLAASLDKTSAGEIGRSPTITFDPVFIPCIPLICSDDESECESIHTSDGSGSRMSGKDKTNASEDNGDSSNDQTQISSQELVEQNSNLIAASSLPNPQHVIPDLKQNIDGMHSLDVLEMNQGKDSSTGRLNCVSSNPVRMIKSPQSLTTGDESNKGVLNKLDIKQCLLGFKTSQNLEKRPSTVNSTLLTKRPNYMLSQDIIQKDVRCHNKSQRYGETSTNMKFNSPRRNNEISMKKCVQESELCSKKVLLKKKNAPLFQPISRNNGPSIHSFIEQRKETNNRKFVRAESAPKEREIGYRSSNTLLSRRVSAPLRRTNQIPKINSSTKEKMFSPKENGDDIPESSTLPKKKCTKLHKLKSRWLDRPVETMVKISKSKELDEVDRQDID